MHFNGKTWDKELSKLSVWLSSTSYTILNTYGTEIHFQIAIQLRYGFNIRH